MTVTGGRIEAPTQRPVASEAGLWSGFSGAKTDAGFVTSWLGLLVNRVTSARYGAVIEPDVAAGAFVPIALVPDPRQDASALGPAAEQAVGSGRPAVVPTEGACVVAYPIRRGDGPVLSIVALYLESDNRAEAQLAVREMHWAAGWLTSRAWQGEAESQDAQLRRAAVALDILALANEHARPEPTAMAVANELQSVIACDRVAIGMVVKRHSAPRIRLLAMSYSATFKKRSTVAERLEGLMEEAFDQNGSVVVPKLERVSRAIAVAHSDHVKETRAASVLTVTLHDREGPVGAITCERRQGEPFEESDLLMLESVAALLGPVLEMKRRNHRWIGGKLWDGLVDGLGVLLGPRRLSWKLLAVALVGLAVAAALVTAPFRVQADAVLRGEVQRAAVAPFNGFLESAEVRAGDAVQAGDVLARLDDTDLRLEELRWTSEIDRLTAQQRDALASGERAQAAFLEAQMEQARAQLELTRVELDRGVVRAAIDGTVVSGDLSQRLGAPVQTGEVLFEIAPLDDFRVDIFVDERDLRYVTAGTGGTLALAGRPEEGLPLQVERITPVAEAREGINTFRTEARMQAPDADLRPGMEGIAKIDAGEAKLVWIWTRRLGDWLRTTAWTWQP